MSATDVIDAYMQALPGPARRVASGEWGFTIPPENAAGRPLEVGLRLEKGLLTVRAHALSAPADVDPWTLLRWNRATRLARYAGTESKEVWVHGDLPASAVSERTLDRLLGLVVEAAVAIRELQVARRQYHGGGWLEPEDEEIDPGGLEIID